MVPRSAPIRSMLAALVVAVAAVVVLAGSARAEEAVILDNGAVLRGLVVRENAKEVVFRLDGIGRDSRVTIEKSRIARRFVTKDTTVAPALADPAIDEAADAAAPFLATDVPSNVGHGPVPIAPSLVRMATLPDEEPSAAGEGFFQRSARRALVAFPKGALSRAALVALAIALLLSLVEIGGRMVDVDGLTLGKSTTLALLLGLLVTIDALASDTLLRADRAPVLILAELLAFVGCTAGILRCGLAAAVQLLAFLVFAGALVALVTGAVLVSI